MDGVKVVKFFIILFTSFLISLGLLDLMYSFRRKRFFINPLLIIWSLTVIAGFVFIYGKRLHEEYATGQIDLKNAVSIYYYLNIICALVNYLWQLAKTNKILKFYNTVPVFDCMSYFCIDHRSVKKAALLTFIKIILIPIIVEINLILRELRKGEESNLLETLYHLYPMVIANFLPNCLFAGFVVCRECMKALNILLKLVENEANFYQNVKQMKLNTRFYRMQIFCDLSDKLDELSEKYNLVCFYTLEYTQLISLPLICSLLSNLLGITAGCFQQYYAIADTMINEETYDVFDALTNGVFLAISFSEIAILNMVVNDCIEKVSNGEVEVHKCIV
ncbi:putative gustatory receptor 94a [Musca autumnalis]|uniref:putative gustatory receptor 94a n=1 Tax=Musca autumnalis TaxID=221902 RepID=UPI003CED6F38